MPSDPQALPGEIAVVPAVIASAGQWHLAPEAVQSTYMDFTPSLIIWKSF